MDEIMRKYEIKHVLDEMSLEDLSTLEMELDIYIDERIKTEKDAEVVKRVTGLRLAVAGVKGLMFNRNAKKFIEENNLRGE